MAVRTDSSGDTLIRRLAEGWKELWDHARGALTRFRPGRAEEEDKSVPALRSPTRWGLLPADVETREDEVVVHLEAPGLDAKDIDVDVVGGMLRIRGEKHAQRSEKRGDFVVSERAYGRFERRIALPCEVDADQAKARYRHGVLTLTLPRTEKTRRIRIASG